MGYPVLSITADNGSEFAYHEKISKELNTGFYFAHPYSSWERELNENINRPRKSLGYATPNEILNRFNY